MTAEPTPRERSTTRAGKCRLSVGTALLGFAEHLMANAARAWIEANLEQRRQIQSAIFPEAHRSTAEQLEPPQRA